LQFVTATLRGSGITAAPNTQFSSPALEASGHAYVQLTGSGPINIPATGDWQSWATVTVNVELAAGQQVLTFDQDNGGWNMNYTSFASASGSSTAATSSAAHSRIPAVRPRIA